MKAKEILKMIESGKDIKGLHFVPHSYLCMGFVPDSGGVLKIWGYYPYRIESFGFSTSGKIFFNVKLVNKIGATYEHNDYFKGEKIIKYKFDKGLEFFATESEAIHECHLRNRGKVANGTINMTETSLNLEFQKYVAQIFY